MYMYDLIVTSFDAVMSRCSGITKNTRGYLLSVDAFFSVSPHHLSFKVHNSSTGGNMGMQPGYCLITKYSKQWY